jgi:hypothetical protein
MTHQRHLHPAHKPVDFLPVGDGRDKRALTRYSRRNDRTVRAFNDEVAAKSPTARLYNSFVLLVVSEYIWEHSRYEPGWESLDVNAFQRAILQERLGLDEVAAGNFNLTLTAFYTWLGRRGLVRPGQAAWVVRQLQRHDNDYVRRVLNRIGGRSEARVAPAA